MTIDNPDGDPASGQADASPSGLGPPPGSASPIEFRLDVASGVPTYLQLVQVEHALRLGHLKPGGHLPQVRDVVSSLAINPNTVRKAYKELELKGRRQAGRPGHVVEGTLSQVALPNLATLRRSLLARMATAHAAWLDEDGIVALFTTALRDFHDRHGGQPAAASTGEGRSGPGDGAQAVA